MSSHTSGSIKLIIGPMFAGKSVELIKGVDRYRHSRKRCVLIKHGADVRYDSMVKNGGIVCNNGIEYSGIDLITTSALSDVTAIIAEYDVIGVFESQFFEDILVVDDWANAGKIIICDGLDADFRRDSFGRLAQLIPKCEDVIKLKAICERCQLDASFTQRIGVSTELIDVGGADKYIPVCRKCYITPAPSV